MGIDNEGENPFHFSLDKEAREEGEEEEDPYEWKTKRKKKGGRQ